MTTHFKRWFVNNEYSTPDIEATKHPIHISIIKRNTKRHERYKI